MSDSAFISQDIATLAGCRDVCHHVVQWPSIAARKILPKVPDFSHSALLWYEANGFSGLAAHPFPPTDACASGCQVLFDMEKFSFVLLEQGQVTAQQSLADLTHHECGAWLETVLAEKGYAVEGIATRKAAPVAADHPIAIDQQPYTTNTDTLENLRLWYKIAQAAFLGATTWLGNNGYQAAPIYLWSHHFDLAALTLLQDGDPEVVPSIGMGLSPGDGYYDQPYLYVSAWPPTALKQPASTPKGAIWHAQDFNGFVFTASALLAAAASTEELENLLTAGCIQAVQSHLNQIG